MYGISYITFALHFAILDFIRALNQFSKIEPGLHVECMGYNKLERTMGGMQTMRDGLVIYHTPIVKGDLCYFISYLSDCSLNHKDFN
jgi:hypothetical protein